MSTDPEDLPQTWERPSHAALMAALATLELRPPVWNHRAAKADIVATQESLREQHKAAAARYLGTIIRSPLSWLADDDERDEVWSAASRRMAERCGRTAMGEVLRSWPFEPEAAPAPADASGSSSGVSTPSLEQDVGASIGAMPAPFEPFSLVIREPALTGDSLGLKTWASSYVLARSLPRIGATTLFRLFDESFGQPGPRVLELGSGTGLLGIAAAAVWRVHVTLTDLPGIVDNLKNNAERNAALVEERGGSLTVGRLTWGGRGEDEVDGALFGTPNQFKVVLVADPLYDENHPALLASAIRAHLATDEDARAVVMVPLRDDTTLRLRAAFRAILEGGEGGEGRLTCYEEQELEGQDDWEASSVRCWLGIFGRA